MGLYERLRIDGSRTGERFSDWLQVGPVFSSRDGKRKDRKAIFECKCGGVYLLHVANVYRGLSKGCTDCLPSKIGDTRRRHGLSKTRVHNIWWGMVVRCTTPTIKAWPHYGGRGIRVCERWKTFENFLEDMGQPPEGHEIDRIDVNGNYCPENCRWATVQEQARNKRNSRKLDYKGQLMSTYELSQIAGIRPRLILGRIRKGWSVERAVETPRDTSHFGGAAWAANAGEGE